MGGLEGQIWMSDDEQSETIDQLQDYIRGGH